MHGMQISADEIYSRAGVQFYIDCTQILVFATAVPLAQEGRLGDINGSRDILAMIIDSIRVSNNTSLDLGRESRRMNCVTT